MALRIVQVGVDGAQRGVVALFDDEAPRLLKGIYSTYGLARRAIADQIALADLARDLLGPEVDLRDGKTRLLSPIDHPDPAHLFLTGTGLTHLGSAEGRDKMHKAAASGSMTDSMRMFLMGVEGGKPSGTEPGAQPEWFYKGNGTCLVGDNDELVSPAFALDGSEEPEIAGIYIIDESGTPRRLGFALANEFSDHITERGNYLWLAHSKLRPAALGPELLIGDLPHDVRGTSRIRRGGAIVWEKPFLTGESNMSHHLANLEAHHFKYDIFRQPGDLHVHFFGTATLSFADGFETREGDIFEVQARPFTLPLRNRLARSRSVPPPTVPL